MKQINNPISKAEQGKHKKIKDRGTFRPRDSKGKYDFSNFDLLCTCGHTLGIHAAPNDTPNRPCFNEDQWAEGATGEYCPCKNFKLVTPIPENTSDWEKDLVLYLTSAGDRRRAIHFIRELIATQVAAAEARQKDRIKEWAKQYQSNQQTKDYFKDSSFKGDFVLNLVNETMDDLVKSLDSNPQ